MELIKNLWRGDAGLCFSYWVIGAIGNSLTYIPLIVYFNLATNLDNVMFIMALLTITVLYTCFSAVCIYRSSIKYEEDGDDESWALLARFSLIASIFVLVVADSRIIHVL